MKAAVAKAEGADCQGGQAGDIAPPFVGSGDCRYKPLAGIGTGQQPALASKRKQVGMHTGFGGLMGSEAARQPRLWGRIKTMKCVKLLLLALFLAFTSAALGQQGGAPSSNVEGGDGSVVPRLIKFSGVVSLPNTAAEQNDSKTAQPTTLPIAFSLYEAQEGGSPLWSETQSVQLDPQDATRCCWGLSRRAGCPSTYSPAARPCGWACSRSYPP